MSGIAILRKPEVTTRTGLSASTIRRMIARGEFPAPVQLGPRSVGWKSDLVDAWIAARVKSTLPDVRKAHGQAQAA